MPQTCKLALLDDYQKVALKMADWDRLRKRGVEITVFHEPFSSVEDAARKLAPFDVLGLLRERTAFPRALIEKLPNLKFMVLTGARASSLDDKAATDRGIATPLRSLTNVFPSQYQRWSARWPDIITAERSFPATATLRLPAWTCFNRSPRVGTRR